jgi:DNA polymerase-4
LRVILHIDLNSYFATIEQQANPRLRGKPIGVTGGDRDSRTVLSTASVEAKKLGVKTGMPLWEALKVCPQLILVRGDSDKYLECTKRFINILKDYSPLLEIFSIDESFLELPASSADLAYALEVATNIKRRIREEIGEWVTCSIGISYNKRMAKLASDIHKPDGLVIIADPEAAQLVLDTRPLDDICGIGHRIKYRLYQMGVKNFIDLRKVPLPCLLASFKSYGQTLYDMARGIDHSPIVPFYEKEEIKSVGHRHTIDHDVSDPQEIKQVLLKIAELIARRMRSKNMVGKTITCYFRYAFSSHIDEDNYRRFEGDGAQMTFGYTQDGLEIFQGAWRIFQTLWAGEKIRMIGATVSQLKPTTPHNLTLLPEVKRQERILKALDNINDRFGEFTLQRGVLLHSAKVYRKPNPYLSDRRFSW